MKHFNIMGCTVTVTGLHEKELAKLIRKLEPKPDHSYCVWWDPHWGVGKVCMYVRAKSKAQALRTACDLWGAKNAVGPDKVNDKLFVEKL